MNVCVFCSSSTAIDPSYVELAENVGRELARRGHGLVSGGGRLSCMGAVARGAREGGGRTVGVIPAALASVEFADDDCDELLVVETMRERKAEMESHADAFLALPGGIGTLEEFMEVWTLNQLGEFDKPAGLLDIDGFYQPLLGFVDGMIERGFLPAAHRASIVVSPDPAVLLDGLAALEPVSVPKWMG